MGNALVKFAVSVFKNQEPIRAELWDYEAGFDADFLKRVAGTLMDEQTMTLMINQSLFVEFVNVGGGEFIAEYNVGSDKTSQRFILQRELPRTNQDGFKLLSESFKGFITKTLNARTN